MAPAQMLVRNLEGRTTCLQFTSQTITGADVKVLLEDLEGIPRSAQRLAGGKVDIEDSTVLSATEEGSFPGCSLLLRLVGGKGGFGSLLRGAATKAGQKKTSNYDACRDMSGRRLRHVNAEKQLMEWQEEAAERELEKEGQKFIKQLAKEQRENERDVLEIARIREASMVVAENVTSSVEVGMMEAKRQVALGKRKVEVDVVTQKKSKMWRFLEGDSDEEDGNAEIPRVPESAAALGSGSGSGSDSGSAERAAASSPETSQSPVINPMAVEVGVEDNAGTEVLGWGAAKDGVADLSGPLDLATFGAAQELETLGMDTLKTELQNAGLKCGGSLSERAARLYLLKDLTLEQIDKKHLAKTGSMGAKK